MPFYAVHVSQSGRKALRWSKPCGRASEAAKIGQAKLDSGEASVVFVVSMDDTGKQVLVNFTRPASARRTIGHYEDLLDDLEKDNEGSNEGR